jgi:hypothetical protein
MKRPLLLTLLTALAVVAFVAAFASVVPAFGAPAAQAGRAVIAQPADGASVREVVEVIGTATHPQFQRYQLFVAPDPPPSDQSWIFISETNKEQPLGLLGRWDSRSVPDGAYLLRLRVVRIDGQYDDVVRRIRVSNTRPADTPTPETPLTPLPELPPTEAPVDAAPVIEQPTGQAPATDAAAGAKVPTIAPTPTLGATVSAAGATTRTTTTPTPRGTVVVTSSDSSASLTDSATSIANQLFSGSRLVDTAKKAAMYTAGAFLVVGLFFGVKGVLVWLWYRIKP